MKWLKKPFVHGPEVSNTNVVVLEELTEGRYLKEWTSWEKSERVLIYATNHYSSFKLSDIESTFFDRTDTYLPEGWGTHKMHFTLTDLIPKEKLPGNEYWPGAELVDLTSYNSAVWKKDLEMKNNAQVREGFILLLGALATLTLFAYGLKWLGFGSSGRTLYSGAYSSPWPYASSFTYSTSSSTSRSTVQEKKKQQYLVHDQRVGTISDYGMLPQGKYVLGNTQVKVIGRTKAASLAETSMGQTLVEVEGPDGKRFFTDKNNVEDR